MLRRFVVGEVIEVPRPDRVGPGMSRQKTSRKKGGIRFACGVTTGTSN